MEGEVKKERATKEKGDLRLENIEVLLVWKFKRQWMKKEKDYEYELQRTKTGITFYLSFEGLKRFSEDWKNEGIWMIFL